MRCAVCRKQQFGQLGRHDCSGKLFLGTPTRPAEGFAVRYYLGEMVRIYRLDHMAIRRIEHDPQSLWFTIPLWLLAIFVGGFAVIPVEFRGASFSWHSYLLVVPVLTVFQTVYALLRLGISHGLARWLGGEGTFLRLLRPMLLATPLWLLLSQIIILLQVTATLSLFPLFFIPMLGLALWWLAVWAWICEEVEGVTRIQAIGISLASGILLRLPEWLL